MIDLHYWTTPNGHKLTIFLEEEQTAYQIIPVNISKGEQFKSEFLAISPNDRIPAIFDHKPKDGGKPISVFDLALFYFISPKRPECFSPTTLAGRTEVLQWLFWQMGGLRARTATDGAVSASTHLKNFPTLSIATSTRQTASMACSTNASLTARSWRASIQLRTWPYTRGSFPGSVNDKTWTTSHTSSVGSKLNSGATCHIAGLSEGRSNQHPADRDGRVEIHPVWSNRSDRRGLDVSGVRPWDCNCNSTSLPERSRCGEPASRSCSFIGQAALEN